MFVLFDYQQGRRFIRALRNTTNTAPDPIVIFQTFDDEKPNGRGRKILITQPIGTLASKLGLLRKVNSMGGGVFLQMNAGSGRHDNEITEPLALFIDFDAKLGNPVPDLSPCPPSAINRSSPNSNPSNMHAIWFLRAGEKLEDWDSAMTHLAEVLGGDPSICNRGRVLRLPGSWHCKPGKPWEMCRIEELRPERRYTIAEVLAAFPGKKTSVPMNGDLTQTNGVRKDTALRTLHTNGKHTISSNDLIIDVDFDKLSDRVALATLTEKAEDPTPRGPLNEDDGQNSAHSVLSLETFQRLTVWLKKQGVRYTLRPKSPRFIYLTNCPLNQEHTDTAILIAARGGGIVRKCFHATCSGNKQVWTAFKNAIGGWSELKLGDHTELGTKLIGDLRLDSPESLIFDGFLYRYNAATGMWDTLPGERIEQQILTYSGLSVGSNNRALKLKWSDVGGIRKTAQAKVTRSDFFKTAPAGALFTNGFLEVTDTKLELKPFSADHKARVSYPFKYDPNATAHRWLRYLEEVFAPDADKIEKILLLQEFLGACLIGIAGRFQAAMFLIGDGSNGKSVALKVFEQMFPPDTRASVRPQDMGSEYSRAQLYNKRINIVTEVPERDIFDSSGFKAMTDGSMITGRPIREAPITFKPTAGQLFACNRFPGAADGSDGFWRRVSVLTFNRKFTVAERDTKLDTFLIRTELGAICNWCLIGAQRMLEREQFTIAPSSEETHKQLRLESDTVAMFVREATIRGGQTPFLKLYQAYQGWGRTHGHTRLVASNTFGRRLTALDVPEGRTRDERGRGLTVTDEWLSYCL